MPIFNKLFHNIHHIPFFDLSRLPHREILSRICAVFIVIVFLYFKLNSFAEFPGTPGSLFQFFSKINRHNGTTLFTNSNIQVIWTFRLTIWILETGILCGYIPAYLFRARAVSIAKGFMEVVFPFIISVIPILISFAPYNFTEMVPYHSEYYLISYSISAAMIVLGGAVNLTGLLTLKKAFAIMSEARHLITIGIYKYVRHPLYLGHMIMFLGSLSMRLHSYTIFMYGCFVAGQIIRAYKEEKKLTEAFPEYEAYQHATPMFIPGRLFLGTKEMSDH
jgi:protein-S-isoprenylcysteine O-methyltransferase Ste14